MAASKQVTVQLKRHKQTFIVTSPPTSSLIKAALFELLSQIGGLSKEINLQQENEDEEEEDDIDIPIPTFNDDDSDTEDNKAVEDEEEEEDEAKLLKPSTNKTIPKLEDLILGLPIDPQDPYTSGFKDVKDDTKLSLKDFDIVGFRITDEEYQVIQPIQED